MNRLLYNPNWSMLKKLIALKAATAVPLTEYTITGNPVSFETNVAKPLTKMVIPFTPVQSGSGDPAPDNVRPITGWTGVTAYRTGVNVFDCEFETGSLDVNGQNKISDQNIRSKNYISVVPGEKYKIVYNAVNNQANMKLYQYNKNKEYVSYGWQNKTSYTIPNDVYFLRFYMDPSYSSGTDREIAFNYPNTDADYHAYSGTTIPVSFPAEVGTVYGGELDLLTGVLTVEWGNISSYDGETLPGLWISDRDVYSAGGTPATGAHVVYELATPVLYQLTPEQITTLIGTNTIWTDTNGTNEIKYLKEG